MGETKNIPTHDPQTGDLNPHYEELTGNKNTIFNPELHSKIKGKQIKYSTRVDKKPNFLEDNRIIPDVSHMPNQKRHKIVSFIKSSVRIIGYGLIPFNLTIACVVLIVSELIGIVEEMV